MAVYGIGTDHDPNLVKVGWAASPEDRLKQLQTGSPHKLHIAWQIDVPRYAETAAHRELSHFRLDGEWFGVSPSAAFGALQEALIYNVKSMEPANLLIMPGAKERLEYRALRLGQLGRSNADWPAERLRDAMIEEMAAIDFLVLECAAIQVGYERELESLGLPPSPPSEEAVETVEQHAEAA